MHKNFFEINDLLCEHLQNNTPFSLLRIDNTMGYVIDSLFKGELPVEQFYNENTLIEGGVFPNSMEYAYKTVVPSNIYAMNNCDILGFVDISGSIKNNPQFTSNFGEKPMFFGIDDINVLDPAGMLNVTGKTEVSVPWTSCLKGKKVLVVSTHCETIKHQWKNIDKIWGSNRDKIAPFELVDCIRSPYHPLMDDRQYPNCETWAKTVEHILDKIDSYDYDVLIAGSTTSAPLYSLHAKSRGKVGIQTGGVHQLLFGILGYRWTKVEGYKDWHKMYNEHWIYPLEIDEPTNRNKYSFLETNFAYWKK